MTAHEVRRFVLHLWKLIPEKNHRKRLLAFRRNNTFTKEALAELNEEISYYAKL
jgi:hypothetical protein